MVRRRLFDSPEWGTKTFTQNFSSTSFVKTSGGTYTNLNNIGGSDSSTYATLSFNTSRKTKSTFEFAFKITESDIPSGAEIESVKIDFKWGFLGNLGNGSAAGYGYIYSDNTKMFTTSKFLMDTISAHVDTEQGDSSEWTRNMINNIRITFEATTGNKVKGNPNIQLYGATITIKYHIRKID